MEWIPNGSLRNETKALKQYAPDLARESYYVRLSKYHWIPLPPLVLRAMSRLSA